MKPVDSTLEHQSSPAPSAASRPSGFSVFEFDTPQSLLASFLSHRASTRGTSSSWTLGSWARRLRLSSAAPLSNILKGRKLPSPELARRMAESMELRPLEIEYFETLLEYHRQKNSAEVVRIGLLRKLRALRAIARTDTLDPNRFRLVCQPYHYIIRALTELEGFLEDPRWIQSRIRYPLTEEEITDALQDLILAGMLERNSEGKLTPSSAFSDTPHHYSSEETRNYFREAIALSIRTLDAVPVDQRLFSSNTFSVRLDRVLEMKEFVQSFRDEFCSAMESTDGKSNAVYLLNIQLFPATSHGGDKK